MSKEPLSGREGQSIVEMLIGLGLMALGLSFAILLVFGGQSLLMDRENSIQARFMAGEGINAAVSMRDRDWDELSDGEHGLVFLNNVWQFSSSSDIQNIFTRKVAVTSLDDNTKEVKSEIFWRTDPLRLQNVSLVTLLTNWVNAAPPPDPEDTGGGGLTGDWMNPRTLGSIDLGPGNEATGLDVISKIVYMSAKASSAAKPDFFIINATNGQSPAISSSLETGPGLNAVDATQSYAYAANNNSDVHLQIINIENISSPSLVKSYAVPGVSGPDGIPLAVFYSGSKVYMGFKKNPGPELSIIDVSNPLDPTPLGSYEVNESVNDISVSAGTAYLATDKDGAGLMVLNVENPGSISPLGSNFGDSKTIYYSSASRVYLGISGNLGIADASEASSIAELGNIALGGSVNALSARETLVFAGTSNNNREFQVINVASSSSPTLHSYFNFPQVATGVDYEDNLVYVSVRSNDALRIITSSP